MISTTLHVVIWICAQPLIIGNVPKPIIERAAIVCRDRYMGCTKSITETGELSYRVICRRMMKETK